MRSEPVVTPPADCSALTEALSVFFEGMSSQEFLARSWPHEPRVHHGSPDRLGDLTTAPQMKSILNFIRAHQGTAWLNLRLPDGSYSHETSVSAEAAAPLFQAGLMMDLRDVHRWFVPAAQYLQRLVAELKLQFASHASYCHAFVCPQGTGAPKHFDNREVIVVQLRGEKRWRIAENRALPRPLMPHVVGGPVHPLNRHAAADALNDPAMPVDSVTHVLRPGSVLFLPRGFWHETHALQDSLSLSFGFRVPTWAEMFVNTALAELSKDAHWRAPAFDSGTIRPDGIEPFLRAMRSAIESLHVNPPPPPHSAKHG